MAEGRRRSAAGWRLMAAEMAPMRRRVAGGVVASLGWTGTKVAVPAVTRLAVDRGIVAREPGALVRFTLIIAGLGVVSAVCAGLRRYAAFRIAYGVETSLRVKLFAHLLRLPAAFHDKAQTGELMARGNTDLQAVQSFLTMVPITIGNVVTMVSVTALLLFLDAPLALLALAGLPLLNTLATRFARRLYPEQAALQGELAHLSGIVEETLSGMRVVKGFNAGPRQDARFRRATDHVFRRAVSVIRVRSRYPTLMDLVPQLGLAVVLWVGGHRVLDGRLSVGELVAFNSYVLMLVWPMRSTGMLVAQAQRAAVAATRVAELLETPATIVDPRDPQPLPDAGARRGAVRFRDVRFGYSGDTGPLVLDGLSLDIAAGETVAVVGATASGKSTLVRLIGRAYDVVGGSVELDGVDVRRLALAELRSAVAIVSEDTFLFTDTIEANIRFGRAASGDGPDDVLPYLRAAGADEVLDALPEGMATVLSERGESLSGGQRQRLSIARALAAEPRVLILDDATSAVDPTKEREIRARLRDALAGRTTIIVAHRAATIAMADRVVLLDGGRVVAEGTHEELIAADARYREVLAAGDPSAPGGPDDAAGTGGASRHGGGSARATSGEAAWAG